MRTRQMVTLDYQREEYKNMAGSRYCYHLGPSHHHAESVGCELVASRGGVGAGAARAAHLLQSAQVGGGRRRGRGSIRGRRSLRICREKFRSTGILINLYLQNITQLLNCLKLFCMIVYINLH